MLARSGAIPMTLALNAILFTASLVLGITGFGNAMIAMPLLLFFLTPDSAVPVIRLVSLGLHIFTLAVYRFPVDWVLLRRLILPMIAGNLLGAYLLKSANPQFLLTGMVVVIFTFAVLNLFDLQQITRRLQAPPWLAGLFSGILGGSIAMTGPPVVLFMSQAHGEDKNIFRGTLLVFFMLEVAAGLISYLALGVMTPEILKISLQVFPASLLGLWLGMKVFARFSSATFRRVVLAALIGLSVLVLVTH